MLQHYRPGESKRNVWSSDLSLSWFDLHNPLLTPPLVTFNKNTKLQECLLKVIHWNEIELYCHENKRHSSWSFLISSHIQTITEKKNQTSKLRWTIEYHTDQWGQQYPCSQKDTEECSSRPHTHTLAHTQTHTHARAHTSTHCLASQKRSSIKIARRWQTCPVDTVTVMRCQRY